MGSQRVNEENDETQKETEEVCYESKNRSFFHIRKELVPLKSALFFYYGGVSAMLPFLTLHLQDLGISINQVAVMYAVLPFTSFAGPPVMGFLADKLGAYKNVLIFATFANGLFHMLLLFVPSYSERPFTSNISLFYYQPSNQAFLFPTIPENCDLFKKDLNEKFIQNGMNKFETDLKLMNCIPNEQFYKFQIEPPRIPEHLITSRDLKQKIEQKSNCTSTDFLNCIYEDLGIEKPSIFKMNLLSNDTENSIFGNWDCLNEIEISFPDKLNSLVKSEDGFICQTNINYPIGGTEVIGNNSVTFWVYFILRIIATIFCNSCFSLLDSTTLVLVKKLKGVYGRERIWSIFGLACIPPIAGMLVDKFQSWRGYLDYSPAFVFGNLLLLVTIAVYYTMKLDVEKPDDDYIKNGRKLLKYPEVVAFLIFIFLLGSMWGFVESYLFVYLKVDLSAEAFFLGLTLTVGSLAGLPILFFADKILEKIGRVNAIVLAFVSYLVRYMGYAYIDNFWFALPYEAMEAFTYHLMWVAAATYCADLAPKGLLATLVGIMGSLHFSLGRGNGSFIGGLLYGAFGARQAFKYFGIAAGLIGVLYFFINVFWLNKVVKRRLNNIKNKRDIQTYQLKDENGLPKETEMMIMIGKGNNEKDSPDQDSKPY